MLDAALSALEASGPAAFLRSSWYAYPLVNAAHILALAALFGAILALDLRLLGFFRGVPAQPLVAVLPRVAAGGLALALLTGLALFAVQPTSYLANPIFAVKLALIILGSAHALLLRRTPGWQRLRRGGTSSPSLRVSGALSLLAWTGAIVAGRWLAF